MRFAPVLCGVAITVACDVACAQPNAIDLDRTPPAAALAEFWTEQQLRQTPPLPLPVLDADTEPLNPATPNSAAPPGQSKGSQPSAIARRSGNVNTMPLAWAGKLYFVLPDGRPANCSAQFVAPDTLVTAAHCVRDSQSGAWHQNLLYRHQYDRGRATNFAGACKTTYRAWVAPDKSRYPWDYAMVMLRGSVEQGHFGIEWGWLGKYSNAPKIGYPGDIEDGEVIQVDFGRLGQGWHPNIVALVHGNSRSLNGSSGGAWVGAYDPRGNNQANRVISVSSHFRERDPGTMYGPYWDDAMAQLLANTRRDCRRT